MAAKTLFSLILLTAAATAATSPFVLGVGYTEWLPAHTRGVALDRSGAIYLLSAFLISGDTPSSTVTKLSPDGKTIVWRNQLGFAVTNMAVDPDGGVYVTRLTESKNALKSFTVAKLGSAGTGVAWTFPQMPVNSDYSPALAADSSGRTYLAVSLTSGKGQIYRINAAGTSIDYTSPLGGRPTSVAVDTSGSAFIAGDSAEGSFLAKLAPDGSAVFSVVTPFHQSLTSTVALDANGNAVVYGNGSLQRYDSTGSITSSNVVATWVLSYPGLALDAAGNAYILGTSSATAYPVKNTLATCGSDLLSVVAPDGTLLQTTYIPGAVFYASPLVAIGPNSTVLIVDAAAATFAPTQTGPFPADAAFGTDFLLQLSPNADAQTYPLACLGNAASLQIDAIAPGELLKLIGDGLGPEQAIETTASAQTPFPTQAAGVQVTFDGKPAPLLRVQGTRIDVVVPWSLTPGQNTRVCAAYNGKETNCLSWPVAQTAPGVFTVDGSYAAALNDDGSVNSAANPAPAGSIVSVFATGLGSITPALGDGMLVQTPLPYNVLPVAIGYYTRTSPFAFTFIPAEVTYAGPAPGLVAGTSQINFRAALGGGAVVLLVFSTQSLSFGIHVASVAPWLR